MGPRRLCASQVAGLAGGAKARGVSCAVQAHQTLDKRAHTRHALAGCGERFQASPVVVVCIKLHRRASVPSRRRHARPGASPGCVLWGPMERRSIAPGPVLGWGCPEGVWEGRQGIGEWRGGATGSVATFQCRKRTGLSCSSGGGVSSG